MTKKIPPLYAPKFGEGYSLSFKRAVNAITRELMPSEGEENHHLGYSHAQAMFKSPQHASALRRLKHECEEFAEEYEKDNPQTPELNKRQIYAMEILARAYLS